MKSALRLAQKQVASMIEVQSAHFSSLMPHEGASSVSEHARDEEIVLVDSLKRLVEDTPVKLEDEEEGNFDALIETVSPSTSSTSEASPLILPAAGVPVQSTLNGALTPGFYAVPSELQEALDKHAISTAMEIYQTKGGLNRKERGRREGQFRSELVAWLKTHPELSKYGSFLQDMAVESTMSTAFKRSVLAGFRADGRALHELRPLRSIPNVLPQVHGSAFFQRGDTHVLCTTTLGSKEDSRSGRPLSGGKETPSNFYLHYDFPPYCVGDTGNASQLNRRMIGHGALAEKAVRAVLPSFEDFPYTVRVFSEVTSSSGSSSMASACGTSLALIDAGVPLKNIVAGVSIGLISERPFTEENISSRFQNDYVLLTDILGMEDHYGAMDFKVAGSKEGVTAIQLDVKNTPGVPLSILEEALEKASAAREDIIISLEVGSSSDAMRTLKDIAPRAYIIRCDNERRANLIGPGGEMIRYIEKTFDCAIDMSVEGEVYVFGKKAATVEEAASLIRDLVLDVKVGDVYSAEVSELKDFGALVKIARCQEALLHCSEISHNKALARKPISDLLAVGQELQVKVQVVELSTGQIKVSRKALLDASRSDEDDLIPENTALLKRLNSGGGGNTIGSPSSARADIPLFPVNPPRFPVLFHLPTLSEYLNCGCRKWNRDFFRKFVASKEDIDRVMTPPQSGPPTPSASAASSQQTVKAAEEIKGIPVVGIASSVKNVDPTTPKPWRRVENVAASKDAVGLKPIKSQNGTINGNRDKHQKKVVVSETSEQRKAREAYLQRLENALRLERDEADSDSPPQVTEMVTTNNETQVEVELEHEAHSWDLSSVKPVDYSQRLLDNDNYDHVTSKSNLSDSSILKETIESGSITAVEDETPVKKERKKRVVKEKKEPKEKKIKEAKPKVVKEPKPRVVKEKILKEKKGKNAKIAIPQEEDGGQQAVEAAAVSSS